MNVAKIQKTFQPWWHHSNVLKNQNLFTLYDITRMKLKSKTFSALMMSFECS